MEAVWFQGPRKEVSRKGIVVGSGLGVGRLRKEKVLSEEGVKLDPSIASVDIPYKNIPHISDSTTAFPFWTQKEAPFKPAGV